MLKKIDYFLNLAKENDTEKEILLYLMSSYETRSYVNYIKHSELEVKDDIPIFLYRRIFRQ